MKPKKPSEPPSPDLEGIDEAVLALLRLTSFTEKVGEFSATRAWKRHDWDALGRLHEKGFIGNRVGKTESIVFTEEGRQRAAPWRRSCLPQRPANESSTGGREGETVRHRQARE